MRWFVGDVHGCARELEDLLRRIRFDAGRDEIWFTGDLVNRGPDSRAALRLWADLGGRGVIGNHDLYAIRVFDGSRKRDPDTLDDLLAAPDAADLLDRLARQPAIRLLPGGPTGAICLVHAGLHPAWTDLRAMAERLRDTAADPARRKDPDLRFATLVRCCTSDGATVDWNGPAEQCPDSAAPWDAHYRGTHFVVHGHWASRGIHRTPMVLGLDSGCAWGGALTAWCAEEDRLVQVPARPL
jgi:bis(5'-nucleosyl)-tetraphosphatase (symmetrical)